MILMTPTFNLYHSYIPQKSLHNPSKYKPILTDSFFETNRSIAAIINYHGTWINLCVMTILSKAMLKILISYLVVS